MEIERNLLTLYIGLHGVIDRVVDLSINPASAKFIGCVYQPVLASMD